MLKYKQVTHYLNKTVSKVRNKRYLRWRNEEKSSSVSAYTIYVIYSAYFTRFYGNDIKSFMSIMRILFGLFINDVQKLGRGGLELCDTPYKIKFVTEWAYRSNFFAWRHLWTAPFVMFQSAVKLFLRKILWKPFFFVLSFSFKGFFMCTLWSSQFLSIYNDLSLNEYHYEAIHALLYFNCMFKIQICAPIMRM